MRRALLLCCSLLLALCLGEALVRLRDVDPHPAAMYRFHSLYGWTMDPGVGRGQNSRPPDLRTADADERAASAPRVLVLGDSFTFAVERPWPMSFAGILTDTVTSRGGSLLSLSAGGWGTAQEYLALTHEGLAWEPDVVVLQVFPFNDVCNNGIEMAHTCSWQDHLRPYFVVGEEGLEQTWLQPMRGRLRAVSRLVGLLDRWDWSRRMGSPGESAAEFRRRTTEFTRASAHAVGLEHEGKVYSLFPAAAQPEPVRQAWATTEALFTAIHAVLAQRGIALIAVVIPFKETFAPDWDEYRKGRPQVMEPDVGTRHAEEIFARLGVPVVSVRRQIEQCELVASDLFNRGNRHLSAVGHRWTAQWILDALDRCGTGSSCLEMEASTAACTAP